jgi:hypothetical protein
MRVRIDFVTGAFRIFAVGWALQERQIVESQAGANSVTKGANFIHLFGFSGVTMRHNGNCMGGLLMPLGSYNGVKFCRELTRVPAPSKCVGNLLKLGVL